MSRGEHDEFFGLTNVLPGSAKLGAIADALASATEYGPDDTTMFRVIEVHGTQAAKELKSVYDSLEDNPTYPHKPNYDYLKKLWDSADFDSADNLVLSINGSEIFDFIVDRIGDSEEMKTEKEMHKILEPYFLRKLTDSYQS